MTLLLRIILKNMKTDIQLESILFASPRPLSRSALRKVLNMSEQELSEAIAIVRARRNSIASGIHLLEEDNRLQFVTNPDCAEVVQSFVKQDVFGELTRPSLETLTIIAYRGPITKPEIEQIRGVNCSLILRNLLLRGLINEEENKEQLQMQYTVSVDFLRHLGLHNVGELPDYVSLHSSEIIASVLQDL